MRWRAANDAKRFRSLPREEAIARLKRASTQMLQIFDGLSEQDWGSFNVHHPYMGPLPTLFYPAFHVMDYGVHTWDIVYGLGDKLAEMEERTAGVLVPFMFILMSVTVDANAAKGSDLAYGIEVSGEWGGGWLVTVRDGKFEYQPAGAGFEGSSALFRHDASDFVLTSFGRFPGGAASGDPEIIDRVRGLFFRI
jgi:hypothetical protein